MDTYPIVITEKAQSDIAECVSFVLNVSKEAAINLSNDIYSMISSLSTFPERNPVFEMPKSFPYFVRKMVINKRYIVLYSVEDIVVIYRVLDARRQLSHLI